ncbi:MAG TPA: hypothetical protein VFG30_06535 [Polyangiales bacterium]|nr:hypothetical protein [Polyangiales bacterium]
MQRSTHSILPTQSYYTAFACLIALGCGGNSGTATPPAAGSSGMIGAPGTSGTTGTPTAGGTPTTGTPTGTAGNTTPGATAGVIAAGSGGMTAAGGTGAAGTSAPAGGTGASPAPTADVGAASVLQFHKHATRDGVYVDAAFTRTAAAMLKKDAAFHAMTNGQIWAQPLYWDAGAGGKDLVIAATQTNQVSAFDPATGAVVWQKTLAPPVSDGLPGATIMPLGVTGTPVIDANTKTLYVAAMTAGPKHQVFALSLDDGSVKPGWPANVDGLMSTSGTKFVSRNQNQRGALLLLGDTLYVPYGGHSLDCGEYHGWVVGVPLANPAQPIAFSTAAFAAGVWASGGLASDGTSIFAATGNAMATASSDEFPTFSTPATWSQNNAVLRLGKDLKQITQSDTKNFYAAQNWAEFDNQDFDLGSSGAVLVTVPGATPSELVIAFGKSGEAFLLDRANLGGMGGHLAKLKVTNAGVLSGIIVAPAAYTTPTGTFVVFRGVETLTGCAVGMGNIGAVKIDATSPPKISVAWCAGPNGNGSPIVTMTDGTADSIVWYLGSGKLYGLNGENGMAITSVDVGTTVKWHTPIAAKGRIFVGTNTGLVALTTK